MGVGSWRAVRKFQSLFPILHPCLLVFLALAVFVSGCSPPGPRALLAGKRLLERGDYDGAVAQLQTATTLLATNAAAWNYYGVALQHAGQPADAAQAYQNALKFDRDLVEAHYNLGCLWLEQNKPDAARSEFTAYTLRRNNTPEGWLKLGAAQLKLRDLHPAETSFSTALSLNANNAEALNGLGLASMERGNPVDAAKFFSAVVQIHPDYAPALLNLATVQEQYLHDGTAALKNYRAYLALTPRPADWDAVNNLAGSLEQSAPVAAVRAPPTRENETIVPAKPNAAAARPPASAKPQPVARNTPGQVVTVRPEPAIVASGNEENHFQPETTPATAPVRGPGASRRTNPVRSSGSSTQSQNYSQNRVTPLAYGNSVSVTSPAPAPARLVPPAPPTFPRYLYLSPHKPRAGDRKAAERAFADARRSEHNEDWTGAMESYHKAAGQDPAWFEAQYNCAVLAYRVHNLDQSLASSEMALAIRPDSVDARYNFALGLKASDYAQDAVNELKKIVAANPDEARAQLALGNLYAEQMQDPAQARQHYLKWLALDPHNPQANNIRYWLSANPP